MKKLSFILSVVFLLNVLYFPSVFAAAGDTFNIGNFTYTVRADGVTVSLTGTVAGSLSGTVTIPETVSDGTTTYPVKTIGYAAVHDQKSLTGVIMPDTIIAVGVNAFFGCSALKTVKLSSNLTGTMNGTFYWCEALESVTIPAGVQVLDTTFKRCTNLTSVTIEGAGTVPGDYDGEGVFDECDKSKLVVTAPAGSAAAKYATSKGITVNEVGGTTPPPQTATAFESGDFKYSIIKDTDNVKVTGFSAASAKSGKYTLPPTVVYDSKTYTVTHISDIAFLNQKNITEFIMPDTVESVGYGIFNSCTSLTSVHLSDNLKNASGSNQLVRTFEGCTSLKTVRIPAGIKCLPLTFINSGVKNVILTASSTELPKGNNNEYSPFTDTTGVIVYYKSGCGVGGTFADQISTYRIYDGDIAYADKKDGTAEVVGAVPDKTLSDEVIIPSKVGNLTVLSIADEAFASTEEKDNTEITSVVIPDTVLSVGNNVFSGCIGLENVSVSKNLTGSLQGTFIGCTSLTQITVPEGVTILNKTFDGCTSLNKVNIATTVTTLTRGVFNGCTALSSLAVPITVTQITDDDHTAGSVFPSSCTLTVEADSAALTYAQTYSKQYNVKALLSITVNSGVAEITAVNYRISGDYSIPSTVNVSDTNYNVTSIGANAFANQDILKTLSIPSSVTSISADSFSGCTNDEFAVRVSSDSPIYAQIKTLNNTYIVDDAISKLAYEKGKNDSGWTVFGSANGSNISGILNITEFDEMNVIKIADSAFENQTGITSVTMDNTITDIGKYAFKGCTNLENAQLSSNAEGTLYGTFSGCTGLSAISIPSKITALKETYNGCESLVKVTIPNNITAIYENSFANCTALETVVIPESVIDFDGWVGFKDESAEEAEYIATNSGKAWTDNPFKGSTNEKLAICARRGSEAEEFAYSSGIKFIDIDKGNYAVDCSDVSDGKIDVSVRDIHGNGNIKLICALYNQNGSLSKCEFQETVFSGSVYDTQFTPEGYQEGMECKVFAWNNGIIPTCASKSTKAPKPLKILFLGNSITQHSPYSVVGWFGTSGMAATSVDKDYVHILESYAKSVNKNVEILITSVWSLETGYDNINALMQQEANLQAAKAFDADIIIASFGENVRNNENEGSLGGNFENDTAYNADYYEASVRAFIKEGKNVPVISITSMMGNKAEVLTAKEQACTNNNWPYIDFNTDADYKEVKNKAYLLTESQVEEGLENGVFDSNVPIAAGVYVHPGNNGMRAMANRIWQYLEPIVENKTFDE